MPTGDNWGPAVPARPAWWQTGDGPARRGHRAWRKIALWGVVAPFAAFGVLMFVLMVVAVLTPGRPGG